MSKRVRFVFDGVCDWRRIVVALALAAALTGLPLMSANVPGPLSNLFAQPAYACPVGGNCG